MKNVFWLLPLMLLVSACEKEKFTKRELQIPAHVLIDLNDDGTSDFEIAYQQSIWDGANTSGFAWRGRVMPLPDNAVLDSLETSPHFPFEGETIDNNLPNQLSWETSSAGITLVDIFSTGENPDRWPQNWTRRYVDRSSPKFIGLRLKAEAGAEPVFGWIRVEIDLRSGGISVLDKGFATGSVIVGL